MIFVFSFFRLVNFIEITEGQEGFTAMQASLQLLIRFIYLSAAMASAYKEFFFSFWFYVFQNGPAVWVLTEGSSVMVRFSLHIELAR